jgi:hypothetical protein
VAIEAPGESEPEAMRATAAFGACEPRLQVGPPELFADEHRISIAPLDLITRGLRAFAGEQDPLDLVASVRGRELKIHPDAPISKLGLLGFEMKVVTALRATPQTFEELVAAHIVHPRALTATLFILQELRCLEGAAAPPVDVTGRREPPVRRELSEPKELVCAAIPTTAELELQLQQMKRQTNRERLGVATTSTPKEVKAALARRLYLYQPDRLMPSQRELATKICAEFERAAREVLGVGDGPNLAAPEPSSAKLLLAEAEHHIRSGRFHAAESLALRVLDEDPYHVEGTVLLAWSQAEAMGVRPCEHGQRTDIYNKQLRMLREVVRDHSKNVRARYFFAQLLRRSGRFDGAMRQFAIIVQQEPNHVGARRELRIHEMRARKRRQTGVLDRLLKRKGS